MTFAILALGVLGVSSASLLVRLASEASPLVIGAYRLAIASLVVAPAALTWPRGALHAPGRGQVRSAGFSPCGGGGAALSPGSHTSFIAIASGLFLALHLGAWIASLSYTSITSSTVLVTTTPVLLALLPARWRGDPLSHRALAGVLAAFTGAAIIAFGDAGIDLGMAGGDVLALLGAVAMAGHRITGRSLLRAGVRPMTYLALVYPVAALALGGVAAGLAQPFAGFREDTYAALLALGLVPQLIGHSALNWALSRVSAVAVSTAVTGEPVGATLLALLFLHEVPTVAQLTGGVLVLVGTYVVLREEQRA